MNHNEWMKNSGFCKRLKQARTKKRMVQEDVVKQMQGRFSVGILEAYENGNICPSVGRVVELARIYGQHGLAVWHGCRQGEKAVKLYIAATPDKYELPMIVADSAAELARLCGCHRDIIHGEIYRKAHRKARKYYQKTKEYSFHVVEVPDDD